jgi:AraC family transcriptional regulator of arabinose operon
MSRALELLDTTDQSIAAGAAATGYPDSFYFARQFKKVHGVTPFTAEHDCRREIDCVDWSEA